MVIIQTRQSSRESNSYDLAEQQRQTLCALEDAEGSEPKRVILSIAQDAGTMIQGDAPPSVARVKRGVQQPLTELECDSHQGVAAPRTPIVTGIAAKSSRRSEMYWEKSHHQSYDVGKNKTQTGSTSAQSRWAT